ncbi:hypothetical protein EJ110_NYTH09638 [Nymphaea thermarum]|nr:hypothetical protein EJ110_NYTH09638 [Nymphaea thermarum]
MGLRTRCFPSDHSKYPNLNVPLGKEVVEVKVTLELHHKRWVVQATRSPSASELPASHNRDLLLGVPNAAKKVEVVIGRDVIHKAWIQRLLWNNMSRPVNQW